MLQNEHFSKIARIFILVFLCSEMHSSSQQQQQQNTHTASRHEDYFNSTDESTIEYSKHLASIRLATKDSKVFGEGHICAGALIAPSVVLTAARCIYNFPLQSNRHPSEFKIVLGTHNRHQQTEHTLVYGVTHVYYPSSFKPWTLSDDIAVMLMERDVPADHAMVKPISLLEPNTKYNHIKSENDDKVFTQIAWSHLEMSPHLLTVNVTQLPLATCAKSYGQLFRNDMICTKMTNSVSDECHQTSEIGSPLIYNKKLLGIAIGLNGCIFQKSPALYTDATSHRQWIYAHIGDGTNQNGSIWGTLGFLLFTLFTLRKCYSSGKC